MKIPCCFVCQTRYNEEDCVPLLLQCGHGFYRECLSRIFSASSDATLTCPRCRYVSTVGNSVQALRKNYAVLALLHSIAAATSNGGGGRGGNFDVNYTYNEEEEEVEEEEEELWWGRRALAHWDLKLVWRIEEGRRAEVEMWMTVIGEIV